MLGRLLAGLIGAVGSAGRLGGRPLGRAIGLIANMFAALVPRSAERGNIVEHGVLLFATSDGRSAADALAGQVGASKTASACLSRPHAAASDASRGRGARNFTSSDRSASGGSAPARCGEAAADGNHVAALTALGLPTMMMHRTARPASTCSADPGVSLTSWRWPMPNSSALRLRRGTASTLWDLGRSDDAVMAIDPVVTPELRSIDTLRRIRDVTAIGMDRTRRPRAVATGRGGCPDWLATLLFEFDQVGELVDLASAPTFVESLGPAERFSVARARYIWRDFDGSTRLLEPLRAAAIGGMRTSSWPGSSLSRASHPRPSSAVCGHVVREGFDEVAYLGLHQLNRHDEAFSAFLPDVDRHRLVEVFGGRADFTGTDQVEHRLRSSQGGPGDEILMAAAYPELLRRADRTEAACDPRLHRLLSRSFPEVTFHPCERRASRSSPGFCAPGRATRADHVLYEHLDQPLDAVARAADRVMFGRSLGTLLSALLPVEAYLFPEQTMVDRHRTRVAGGVGVVWRSEFADAVRSIHYLMPDDLAPLVELCSPIVCLQHDVRPDERNELERVFGDTVVCSMTLTCGTTSTRWPPSLHHRWSGSARRSSR